MAILSNIFSPSDSGAASQSWTNDTDIGVSIEVPIGYEWSYEQDGTTYSGGNVTTIAIDAQLSHILGSAWNADTRDEDAEAQQPAPGNDDAVANPYAPPAEPGDTGNGNGWTEADTEADDDTGGGVSGGRLDPDQETLEPHGGSMAVMPADDADMV